MISAPAKGRTRRGTAEFVWGLSLGLLLYNSTAQLIPNHTALYVPLNLAAASVLVLVSRRFGLSATELGLARRQARRGVAFGAAVAVVVGLTLLLATTVPELHGLLDDARVTGIGPGLVAYRALVRIPLGTALFEELAFRGVLLGAWSRLTNPLRAAAGSSVVFGLWHVRPTIDLFDANALAQGGPARLGLVVASVVLTAAAGYLFCLLRLHTRSLLAPFIAHAAINAFAILAAYSVIA
jgi:membrane protease YdiL (CAAX protease family)